MAAERTVLVRLKADVSGFNKGLLEAAAGVDALRKEINTTNDRTAWLTQGILAIAPALVPLGAAAVPVFAGIAAQMTVAGVAAGTLALGFDGIGGAVKALNTYQLTPTVENLTKLQQAMDKIGPDGAQFVQFLDGLTPQLTDLQMAARAGMFPGMEEGITHLLTLLPRVRDIVSQVAEGIGQLSAEGGKNLAGPKFQEFFQFLDTDAKPILIEMGHTVGNLADGLAALFVDLVPEAKGFSSGLEAASASFAKWAHSVDDTKGFHDFLDYVNQAGPQAVAFLESLGKAVLSLVEAGAPVGTVLLPLLTHLLDLFTAIASTPLGSTLLAFGSLLSLYGRLAAIGGNLLTGKWGAGFAAQTAAIRTGLPTYREFGNTLMHSMHSQDILNTYFETGAKRAIESRNAVSAWVKSVAPMASQAALLGVIMTGVDQKIGLSNTASLALAGSLAGPWGAAVGGAVGLAMDFKSATSDMADSTKKLDAVFSSSTSTIQDYTAALSAARVERDKQAAFEHSGFGTFVTHPAQTFALDSQYAEGKDPAAEKAQAVLNADVQQLQAQTALLGIAQKLGSKTLGPNIPFAANSAKGIQQLTDIANRAQPAMDALGISLQRLSTEPWGAQQKDVAAIAEWTKNADSARGRAKNMSSALQGLNGHMVSTDQAAQALSAAMDALFGPKMSVNATRNAWLENLRALHTQLDANSKAILGNSNAALKNQDAIRSNASGLLDHLKAMAANGAGSEQLSGAYHRERAALVQTAGQLGMNKHALDIYLHSIGLTPKAVSTLVKFNGADEANRSIQSIIDGLSHIHDKTIHITTMTNATVAEHVIPAHHKAAGGWMVGPGGPRDDMIPALLSNGEFVVNAYAAARNRALLESMNARKFADGGSTLTSDGGKPDDTRMRGLQHSIDQLTKSVDADKKSRDDLRAQETQLAQGVRDSFRSQFLGVTDSVWTNASSPFSILRGDTRDARAYTKAIHDLDKRGVSGAFAAQIDTLAGAQQVDAMSNRQLHRLEQAFAARQHASAVAGQTEGQVAWGQKLNEANRELHQANAHLKVLEREMKHVKAEQAKQAKRTGDAVGNKINNASSTANRRVRH